MGVGAAGRTEEAADYELSYLTSTQLASLDLVCATRGVLDSTRGENHVEGGH